MFVFNEDTAIEDLGNGVKRKVLAHGGNMMAVEVHFSKG
ncbi:cupin domain-containing protein, partial [Escherichia coli]